MSCGEKGLWVYHQHQTPNPLIPALAGLPPQAVLCHQSKMYYAPHNEIRGDREGTAWQTLEKGGKRKRGILNEAGADDDRRIERGRVGQDIDREESEGNI